MGDPVEEKEGQHEGALITSGQTPQQDAPAMPSERRA